MLIKVCGMREPDNIRAIESLGIDLNSRFEVRPGVKDPELLQRFIEKFRNNCK